MRKAQREAILTKLEETYKGSKTALNYNSPFEPFGSCNSFGPMYG